MRRKAALIVLSLIGLARVRIDGKTYRPEPDRERISVRIASDCRDSGTSLTRPLLNQFVGHGHKLLLARILASIRACRLATLGASLLPGPSEPPKKGPHHLRL